MKQLTDIVSRLRSEDGCPWDREQTLESVKECLLEECYEVIDAIDSGDPEQHKEELGDLLLQVLFQSQIQTEAGNFSLNDVAETLAAKLIRRHPHVFGDDSAADSAEVLRKWEEIKASEKPEGKKSIIQGIPRHLPALLKAQRVQAKVARVGFDWTEVEDVVAKIDEELAEVKEALADGNPAELKAEIGDLLFAVVNLSRFRGQNAESALDETVARFSKRFRLVEDMVRADGRKMTDCTLAELDVYWEAAKKQLQGT